MMQCVSTIDLTTFMPMDNQKAFFLDTNVLYWFTYPRFTNVSKPHDKLRAAPYFDFVDKLVHKGLPKMPEERNQLKRNLATALISDDSDFSTMEQIHLYTANVAVLAKSASL